MKNAMVVVAVLLFNLANAAGQARVLTNDSLTGLPVIPTTVTKYGGNEPTKLPDATVCKSKMQGNLYPLIYYMFSKNYSKASATVGATVEWYASHLTGFKMAHGYDSARSQDVFYNADRTVLVIVTGSPGAKGEDADAYGVAYERYQPGLSEQTITGLTQGTIVCQ
jgi:hypothetical protein